MRLVSSQIYNYRDEHETKLHSLAYALGEDGAANLRCEIFYKKSCRVN